MGQRDYVLHLHLKFEYFDAISRGEKLEEFRLASKWRRRLDDKLYFWIRLYRGFEPVTEKTVIDLRYQGYKLRTITHPHFGGDPVEVCAIDVSGIRKGGC